MPVENAFTMKFYFIIQKALKNNRNINKYAVKFLKMFLVFKNSKEQIQGTRYNCETNLAHQHNGFRKVVI